MNFVQIWVPLGAYLLGSIPTAYLMVRGITGEDIRQMGDGNMGAKNTFHSVGKITGLIVAVIDIGKGALAVIITQAISQNDLMTLLAGFCVVLGHDFSIFLGFRGGQGMSATVGVFVALFPLITFLAFIAFLVLLVLTRNWDLSCGISLTSLVAGIWLTDHPTNLVVFSILLRPWIGVSKLIQTWRARRLAH
jgi:glycerol-3-phosphate acyltransferase PlsY